MSLGHLMTEGRNPASERIDSLTAEELVQVMNSEDAGVAAAVGGQRTPIARAIELIAGRLRRGGRLFYVGAGTSGRLGVLDATECPPTFRTPPELVVGVIAGGPSALTRAVEGAEDRPQLGAADLGQHLLTGRDVVVGIATSGRTPYVLGALEYARQQGAATVGISCNPDSELAARSDLLITPLVGPEVISGSTRLKAGTATKMVLNMLSTGAMVLLGKTYGNLMVDLRATNTKLQDRARRILTSVTGVDPAEADRLLADCQGELKTAIVVGRRGVAPVEARRLLADADGHLRRVVEPVESRSLDGGDRPLLLAVDGGGTKTVAWLAEPQGRQIVGRGRAGPSNVRWVDWPAALAEIRLAVERAFLDAGIRRQPAEAACLALAGAGRADDRRRLADWARAEQLAGQVRVVSDADAVLAAAPAATPAIALVAGTGSIAVGQDRSGRRARAGGWGPVVGDEASGYWIALAGLRCAARAADGRGQPTRLLDDFLQRLGMAEPSELSGGLDARAGGRAELASLADVVAQAAEQGDEPAQQVLAEAAEQLAEMVQAVARQLELADRPFPLVLAGGALVHIGPLRARLNASLAARQLHPQSVQIVAEPVAGALALLDRAAEATDDTRSTGERPGRG